MTEAAVKTFFCPHCSKAVKPECEESGQWLMFNPKVRCKCGKDVSKEFFFWLVSSGTKFKRSQRVGRQEQRQKFIPNIKGTKPKRLLRKANIAESDELTTQQIVFCHEYMVDFNGRQAAIRAQYAPGSAEVKASKLLKLDKIQRYLSVLKEERKAKATKTADDIQREMERIAFTNITDVISFNRDGLTVLKESDELSDDAKAALESVQFTETMVGISVKVKMRDKIAALKLLGQQQGIFKDKMDVNVLIETYEQKRKRLGLDD